MNIRIDSELKKQFEAFCVFAKMAVRECKIPFEIKASNDPFYSQENIDRLQKSIAQLESTGGTVHEVNLDD